MGKIKNSLLRIKRLAMGHKKIFLVALIVLVVIGYLIWPKNPKQILTENVSIKDVVKTVSVTGKIASDNNVNLSFQTSGTLDYLGVKLGNYVEKYQTIASLNKDDLWANFRQAQQDFTAAKAASEQYYTDHTNATESYDEKVQRTALDATQNKAYDQMVIAQKAIDNFRLYSPIEGILTRADVETAGVNITPATIFTVTDPNSLNFKLEVDQADIGQVVIGQDVKVSLDSFPDKELNITVDKIDFVSHTTTSGGTAYYVDAKIQNNVNYRVGMSGNADIIVAAKNHVLTISASSIVDGNSVYVKTASKYMKRKITLGLQNDTISEITSGLSEGETVAIDPSSVPPNLIINTK